MTAKYLTILTNQGAARLANAAELGTRLNLTQMAVGDANGALPTPDPAQTKLINQKRIAPLNMLTIDPNNTSQIIAEQIVPENEGGFWIREIGLYDDDGILIAVANCPETYKPQLQEGSGRTQTIRMILIVSSTSAITLKIDPSVVLATRKYADDKAIELKLYVDDLMAKHLAAADPHSQYAPKDSPTFTGKPKAPTPPVIANDTRVATAEFVQAVIAALVSGELANKQPLDKTLTDLSGKDVAALLEYLGLKEAAPGVAMVGDSRNARMSVTAASATATFTADEVVVADTLGGKLYRLANVNKSLNLTTTGAGGMDVAGWSAGFTGFCAVYLIYNPETGVSALLGRNTTTEIAPEVHTTANLPAGFTASALVSVWKVNSFQQFIAGYQLGRSIAIPNTQVLIVAAPVSSYTALSVANAIPRNAKSVDGYVNVNPAASATNSYCTVAADADGIGMKSFGTANSGLLFPFSDLSIKTQQAFYYTIGTAGAMANSYINLTGYKI